MPQSTYTLALDDGTKLLVGADRVLHGQSGAGTIVPIQVDASGALKSAAANVDAGTLVTHSAAAAGVNGADQTNAVGRGVHVVVDITAITGTSPTLTVTIEGKDAASGKYYTLLASAALAAVGTTLLTVYPGVTAAANASASQVLPRTWRVRTAIGGTTPAVTATVGASVVV